MTFIPPAQQSRYADTGRREINVLGRLVLASLAALKEADARTLKGTHEIFIDRIPGVNSQQLQGKVLDFDGRLFRVVKVTDPKASDPTMRGRYLRLISVPADPE